MLITLVGSFIVGLNPPAVMIDLAIQSVAAMSIFVPTYLGFQWHHRSKAGAFMSIVYGGAVLAYCIVNDLQPFGMHAGVSSFVVSAISYILTCYVLLHCKKWCQANLKH